MYSADSIGVILIWNSFYTEMPSKRGNNFCTDVWLHTDPSMISESFHHFLLLGPFWSLDLQTAKVELICIFMIYLYRMASEK